MRDRTEVLAERAMRPPDSLMNQRCSAAHIASVNFSAEGPLGLRITTAGGDPANAIGGAAGISAERGNVTVKADPRPGSDSRLISADEESERLREATSSGCGSCINRKSSPRRCSRPCAG
jgi:hypothetical protein